MREEKLIVSQQAATPPSPLPLAGEGKGEGASSRLALSGRSLIRPSAGAAGHLLPQAGEGKTFFWINLAQRRAALS
ncbi:MAG: hypothetical protein DI565_08435 [Ancylobacter novellus]|uniref:Uncharacterized protein n=1 Tax=Ancylobacter novellus TaxID=921 RepID=A0A2W5MQF5_ANCNO|nr:MAG: hypothetical protein DI565_08435 [Ancylobacter novellus]